MCHNTDGQVRKEEEEEERSMEREEEEEALTRVKEDEERRVSYKNRWTLKRIKSWLGSLVK